MTIPGLSGSSAMNTYLASAYPPSQVRSIQPDGSLPAGMQDPASVLASIPGPMIQAPRAELELASMNSAITQLDQETAMLASQVQQQQAALASYGGGSSSGFGGMDTGSLNSKVGALESQVMAWARQGPTASGSGSSSSGYGTVTIDTSAIATTIPDDAAGLQRTLKHQTEALNQALQGLGGSGAANNIVPSNLSARSTGSYKPNITPEFAKAVQAMAQRLGTRPEYLLAAMAFETGGSYSPSVTNQAGSGATGLIQFMPSTAEGLGTSTGQLASMSQMEQLAYVEKYFQPAKGKLNSLEDVYMHILYPAAAGKGPNAVLFSSGVEYQQNAGLDTNKDGQVTVGEATNKVREYLPSAQAMQQLGIA